MKDADGAGVDAVDQAEEGAVDLEAVVVDAGERLDLLVDDKFEAAVRVAGFGRPILPAAPID